MKNLFFGILLMSTAAYAGGDTIPAAKAAGHGLPSLSKADEAFAARDYVGAFNLYNPVLAADSTNPNLNFKVALCHLYLLNQPKRCIQLLTTAIHHFNDKFDFYDDKQGTATVDAYYFLGKGFMYNNQIDSGMKYLIYYQHMLHNNLPLEAGKQLKMCENAKQLMRTARQLNVQEMGQPVNSGYDESHPVLSLDNNVLFFASRRPSRALKEGQMSDDDIYYSLSGSDGTFGTPQAFPFNTEFDEEPVFLSADGNTLYIRRADKEGNGDILVSKKQGEKWGAPKMMKEVNTPYDEQGLSISNDGTELVVSSNRPGGNGGYDLYIARGKNGNWGQLKNMGPAINTDMDEISPFIFPGGKRVYFSTNGNTDFGMGGFDIFFTEPDSAGNKWSGPFTMGFPVNTSGNELDYTIGSQGITIYTAVGKNGDLDLFNIVAGEYKPDIQEQITEVMGASSETQSVAIVEVEKEKRVEVEKDVEVAKVEEIEKIVEKNVGYVNAEEAKKLDKVIEIQEKEVEVQNIVETEKIVYVNQNQSQQLIDSLVKIIQDDLKTKQFSVFKTFHFDFDSHREVLEQYELKILIDFLKEHKNVTLEVTGHTDNIGTWETNFQVSWDRAKTVYDYLVANRIATNRIIFSGRGSIAPIASNDTPEGRAQNRRVEIALISK